MIKIVIQNVGRGFMMKYLDFCDFLLNQNIDIAMTQEMEFFDENLSMFRNPLYSTFNFPRDKGRKGGGIAFIVKNKLKHLISIKKLQCTKVEAICWIEFLSGSLSFCLLVAFAKILVTN